MFAVKISTLHGVKIVEMNPEQGFLKFCYENIGCQYIETVYARYLHEPYVLIVDEEGRLKDTPEINHIASFLYGYQVHLEPIVGNVLVAKTGMTEEGPDILPLDKAEAEYVAELMEKIAVVYRKFEADIAKEDDEDE